MTVTRRFPTAEEVEAVYGAIRRPMTIREIESDTCIPRELIGYALKSLKMQRKVSPRSKGNLTLWGRRT